MRFWLCSLFFLSSSLALLGQNNSVELIQTISTKAQIIEVDNIGTVYTINGGAITSWDLNGKKISENSSLALGEISSLDASNALKMIVYFKDLSQVIYLDNQLAQRGENVAFDVLGYNQITSICRSYNDGLWVYDQTTFNLLRLNEKLNLDVESGNLAQIIGKVPQPDYMREVNNWLYVADVDNGIYLFDRFGSYAYTIPVKGVHKFVIRADRLFFVKDGKIQYYHLKTKQIAQLNKEEIDFLDFTVFENKLLLITQNELMIYRLNVK
ncbi:MAG: hypothetical protein ACPGVC_05150 [Salibacteraceae bacterium]